MPTWSSFLLIQKAREFPPDTEGQETATLPVDEILAIIFYSMPVTWKNKMVEQGSNYTISTVKEIIHFFETRVANLELKEDKKNLIQSPRLNRRSSPKRERADSDSSIVE